MALYSQDGLAKKREFTSSLSFLKCSEDVNIIAQRFLKNQKLCKLLYYTDADCLTEKGIVPDAEKLKMLDNNIKIIPHLPKENDMMSYIVIQFDNFVASPQNPEFITHYIIIDVICHIDNWKMDGGKLRPFLIMNEIDSMVNGSKLTGMGPAQFVTSQQLLVSPSLAGFSMVYEVGDMS